MDGGSGATYRHTRLALTLLRLPALAVARCAAAFIASLFRRLRSLRDKENVSGPVRNSPNGTAFVNHEQAAKRAGTRRFYRAKGRAGDGWWTPAFPAPCMTEAEQRQ